MVILLPFFTPCTLERMDAICIQIFLEEMVDISRTLYSCMVAKEKQIILNNIHAILCLYALLYFCSLAFCEERKKKENP